MKEQKLTPMFQQYMEIKKNTNDALVFYRLGDFYELFYEDATTASKILGINLTARGSKKDSEIPMCGMPYRSADSYIQKLIMHGHKVAIVEQVEDPKTVKGLVKREVVEFITPGTYFGQENMNVRRVAAIHQDFVYATLVMCDLSSGEMQTIRVMNHEPDIIKVIKQYSILELVIPSEYEKGIQKSLTDKVEIAFSVEDNLDIKQKHADHAVQIALQRLYQYLFTTQKRPMMHLGKLVDLNEKPFMRMDYATLRNLELLNHESDRTLSLFSFLNRTQTSLGARLLREDIMQPLVTVDLINERHLQIETINQHRLEAETIKEALKDTYDIQRVVARISVGRCDAQDLIKLKKTLEAYQSILAVLHPFEPFSFITKLPTLKAVMETIDRAIFDDAPATLRDGKTIKPGINEELDELISIKRDSKTWLMNYERRLRSEGNIKNLKIGYNKSFGYYVEISKGQVSLVNDEMGLIRRQTLTNAERYTSLELKEYETKIVNADNRILEIESDLLQQYIDYVAKHALTIHQIGEALARLDVLSAYAEVSSLPGYVKPVFVSGNKLSIKNGRHPVLEEQMGSQNYVANDASFNDTDIIKILTGPNMGGKSTYMRMVAVNVILAHMGCYVPCDECQLSVIDQMFTRMGANDDILLGQSTFMIEMIEAQNALVNATSNSLILFDEIGRGTATYDGMALAQAIVEYLAHTVKAKTIFSTHYHELVALDQCFEEVSNINVEVHEENDNVTFLYKVIDGGADRSYGINVARLAHLPNQVLEQAKKNLMNFEAQKGAIDLDREVVVVEKTSESYRRVKDLLNKVDVNQMTPLEALGFLAQIQKEMSDDNG